VPLIIELVIIRPAQPIQIVVAPHAAVDRRDGVSIFFELIISPLANEVRPDRRSVQPTYPLLARFLNSMVSCAPIGTTPTEARRSVCTVTLIGPRRGRSHNSSPRAAPGPLNAAITRR
jgi:hypothetical protein